MNALIITTYNRPEYLSRCLQSIKKSGLPINTVIIISDDCSTDPQTIKLIDTFECGNNPVVRLKWNKNGSIKQSLLNAYRLAFDHFKCETVMNLDSDAIVAHGFYQRLVHLKKHFPHHIVTGFHCTTRNANGTERHKILGGGVLIGENSDPSVVPSRPDYIMKQSVGGINFVLNEEQFRRWVEPSLIRTLEHGGNWDHQASIMAMIDSAPIISHVPSLIQHIGFDSAMKHTEHPDVADDFKIVNLQDVTLIGVDCKQLPRLIKAADICEHDITFAKTILLSSQESTDPRVIKIDPINSKEAYSDFMIKHLHKYIDTTHALIIQYDGYVMDAEAWEDEFMQYDYIGAPWWYPDGFNVGNGGFSLRSQQLMKYLASAQFITQTHPEDHIIGRTYRKQLETDGFKFAPVSVARRFSFEGHNSRDKYNGQFGFHGTHHDFINDTYIVNQFRGLGDILFCVPLVRRWMAQGLKVIWPIVPEYLEIAYHFPDIMFVNKSEMRLNFESREFLKTDQGTMVPLRFAESIQGRPYKDCMRAKYDLFNLDWMMWRQLRWARDLKRERKLFYDVLKLNDDEPFQLINRIFRTDKSGKHVINPSEYPFRVVDMKQIPGFSMLDWGMVMERAEMIHTVGTSINYMLECDQLKLKAREIHLYVRAPEEKDFSYYDYLLTMRTYHLHHLNGSVDVINNKKPDVPFVPGPGQVL